MHLHSHFHGNCVKRFRSLSGVTPIVMHPLNPLEKDPLLGIMVLIRMKDAAAIFKDQPGNAGDDARLSGPCKRAMIEVSMEIRYESLAQCRASRYTKKCSSLDSFSQVSESMPPLLVASGFSPKLSALESGGDSRHSSFLLLDCFSLLSTGASPGVHLR